MDIIMILGTEKSRNRYFEKQAEDVYKVVTFLVVELKS